MTSTADSIRAVGLVWFRTDEEIERRILAPLRNDPQRSATVAALIESGTAQSIIRGLHGDNATAFIQLVAGSVDSGGADRLRRTIRESKPTHRWMFDLSYELHTNYRRNGITRLAAPASTVTPVVPTDPSAPFTGSGATGVNPRRVRVPLVDQLQMFLDNEEVRQRYSNPLFDLGEYLDRLDTEQRRRQGQILTQLPIVSGVPYSYAELPSRMSVLQAAANRYNLHAELIAAFLLAEARDQSKLEDGKDYTAATSMVSANTSIGLGQVVVSTARRDDLFSDLLSQEFRSSLSHDQIAFLLTSDEFNIFAAAKYIRKTADQGATTAASTLPHTHDAFPDLDLPAYQRNSRTWPADNIMALASEYTSAPWDDRVTQGWGWFVYEAYLDLMPAARATGPSITETRERYRRWRERQGGRRDLRAVTRPGERRIR